MHFKDLTAAEQRQLAKLSTPEKIQDYLDSLPMNFSDDDPCFSVRQVLQKKTAHCFEGALLAAAALWYHGRKPLLMDLTAAEDDEDHVVALFQKESQGKKYWGAISKTNHAVLRYREPIYATIRELALSYFHEYFLNNGRKTLRTYSAPFNLAKYHSLNWLTSQDNLVELIELMADSKHHKLLTTQQIKNLRKADEIEIKAGKIIEWTPGHR